MKINEEKDAVCVNGELVIYRKFIYLMLNKPQGYLSATEDERDPVVVDLLPDELKHFSPFPVGRLDKDTEGLLLLTNDGDLAAKLTHPRHEVDKTYLARVTGQVSAEAVHRLRVGVTLEDGFRTSPAKIQVIREEAFASAVLITIHEGHNRQVRRMMEAVGHRVLLLRRVRFGPIDIRGVAKGTWRELTEEEIKALKAL